MRIKDNYGLWEQQDEKENEWMCGRPKCINCGERIQDDSAVQIRGDFYCDKCLDDMRVYIED